jgi:Holliday junction resolvase RusA-like endonuclease
VSIVLDIVGEAVAKGRGRVGKDAKGNARVFTPVATKNYEYLIRLVAGRVMAGRPPLEGPVDVDVAVMIAYPNSGTKKKLTDAREGRSRPCTKPDIDNYVKSALDGINKVVFVDDNQVVTLHARKLYGAVPGMRIEVRETYQPAGIEDII